MSKTRLLFNSPDTSIGIWAVATHIYKNLSESFHKNFDIHDKIVVPEPAIGMSDRDGSSDNKVRNLLSIKDNGRKYPGVVFNITVPDFFLLGNMGSAAISFFDHPNIFSERHKMELTSQNLLISPSEWSSRNLSELIGLEVHKIPLGFDDSTFTPYVGPTSGPFTFLHIGFPRWKKNFADVVDCFIRKYGNNHDFQLLLKTYGAFPNRFSPLVDDKLNDYVSKIKSVSNITIIDGFLSDQEMNSLYDSAHCFIETSRLESWGLSAFTAIGKGLPTICINASGLSDFSALAIEIPSKANTLPLRSGAIQHTVFDPDVDALSDAMDMVVNDYAGCRHRALTSAEIVRRSMTWRALAPRYEMVIQNLATHLE
jgi:glycosyltransferase involved in cell wall biosynthesis